MFYVLLLTGFIFATDSSQKINTNTTSILLRNKVQEARQFCCNKRFDTGICFLLDLSIHDGKKRFFVMDMKQEQVIMSGLVTHGHCGTSYLSHVIYSNKPGCCCSSAGKYRVGNFYKGRFGDAYKLYGLESSNNNAYNRAIVLHSHSCVPDQEIYPNQICNSEGCAMVSPAFLQELGSLIAVRKNPILLWVIQ